MSSVAGTGATLTLTVAAMSWRWVLLVPVLVGSCGGDDGGAASTTAATTPAATTTAATTTVSASSAPSTSVEHAGIVPEGFAAQDAEITAADGSVCAVCLWVAATPQERARGLMGITDLGGADGMVFVYDAPTQGDFWMRNTPTPLSIAFFAADGSFVSAADMLPCLDGPDAGCARYGAAGPYTAAIEVFAGDLADLGVAAGSRLDLLGTPCEPNSR